MATWRLLNRSEGQGGKTWLVVDIVHAIAFHAVRLPVYARRAAAMRRARRRHDSNPTRGRN